MHHLCIQALICTGEAWHGTDNVDYDCWPDEESALNREGTIPCPGRSADILRLTNDLEVTAHSFVALSLSCGVGIGLQWVDEPPDSVMIGVDFAVSYRVVTRDSDFYAQHYNNPYFNFA